MGRPVLDDAADEATRNLIPTECRAALAGLMFVRFKGRWVNDPAAEVRADNKLVQLHAASAAGFSIPETLVSAIPEHIRSFVGNAQQQVVVKVVRGLAEFSVPTREITADDIATDASLQACPAIYQELIPGTAHLRVHVFGDDVIAVQIESPHLDWRPDLEVPMQHIELDSKLATQFSGLVRSLGLEMGIIDAKLDTHGQLVFLEINPQGQFLFIEGLTSTPLSERLAAFLTATA